MKNKKTHKLAVFVTATQKEQLDAIMQARKENNALLTQSALLRELVQRGLNSMERAQ